MSAEQTSFSSKVVQFYSVTCLHYVVFAKVVHALHCRCLVHCRPVVGRQARGKIPNQDLATVESQYTQHMLAGWREDLLTLEY